VDRSPEGQTFTRMRSRLKQRLNETHPPLFPPNASLFRRNSFGAGQREGPGPAPSEVSSDGVEDERSMGNDQLTTRKKTPPSLQKRELLRAGTEARRTQRKEDEANNVIRFCQSPSCAFANSLMTIPSAMEKSFASRLSAREGMRMGTRAPTITCASGRSAK
jgi:hypothetical protein